ncbi:MAG: alpha/beta fold hydrolase [Aquisalimonadaceae bacterium]
MNAEQEPLQLHVRSQGDGPPLLVLHGLFGSGMNWNRIARTLARSHEVHLIDLRNHGNSPHDPEMTYPAMAEDVLEVMNTLEIQQAAVLGHSMGGKTAMQLALQHGDRITGLIVADMAPVSYQGEGHGRLIAALQRLDLSRLDSRQAASRELEADIAEIGIRQFLLTNLVQYDHHWRWRIPLDILRQSLDTIRGWPGTRGRYSGPALFLHGEKSDYVTPTGEKTIHDLFPEARIESMRGCGHWLHAENPNGFTALVERFMKVHAI